MKKIAIVVLALCLCVAIFAGCTPAATTVAPTTTAAATTAAATTAGETLALLGMNMVAAPEKGNTFVAIGDYTADGLYYPVNTVGPFSSVVEGLDASGAVVEKLSVSEGYIDLNEMAAKKIVKLKITGPIEAGSVVTEISVPATVADLK